MADYVNALLIGGPADGRRMNVLPDMTFVDVTRITPPTAKHLSWVPAPAKNDFDMYRERYFRVDSWLSEGQRQSGCVFFFHQSIQPTAVSATQLLFAGYRLEVKP